MWGNKKETQESSIDTYKVTYTIPTECISKEDIVRNVSLISTKDDTFLIFMDNKNNLINSYLKHTVLKFERIT